MAPKKKIRKLPPVKTNDPFEKSGTKPDYKNTKDLIPIKKPLIK